jgi:hypothetical protein
MCGLVPNIFDFRDDFGIVASELELRTRTERDGIGEISSLCCGAVLNGRKAIQYSKSRCRYNEPGENRCYFDLASKVKHACAIRILDVAEDNFDVSFGFDPLGEIDLEGLSFSIPDDRLNGNGFVANEDFYCFVIKLAFIVVGVSNVNLGCTETVDFGAGNLEPIAIDCIASA